MNSQESSEEGIPLRRKQAIVQLRQAAKEAADQLTVNTEQSDIDSNCFEEMSDSDDAISAYFDPGRSTRIAAGRRKKQSTPFLMFQRMQEENSDLRDIVNKVFETNCRLEERDRKLEELEKQMKELRAHNEISEENCLMKENSRKHVEIETLLDEWKAHNESLVGRIKQLEDIVGIRMQVNNDLEEENTIFPIDISGAIEIPVSTSLLASAPQVSEFSMNKELIHNRFAFPSARVTSVDTGTDQDPFIPEITAFPSTVQNIFAKGSSNLIPVKRRAQSNSTAVTSSDEADLLMTQSIATSLRVLLDSVFSESQSQIKGDDIRKDIEATEETIDRLRWQLRGAEEKKRRLQEELSKLPEDEHDCITVLEMGRIKQEKSISVLRQLVRKLEGDYNNTVNSVKNNLSRC